MPHEWVPQKTPSSTAFIIFCELVIYDDLIYWYKINGHIREIEFHNFCQVNRNFSEFQIIITKF